MLPKRLLQLGALLVPAVLSVGCATQSATPYDYRAFEASNPHSILVLPPVNNSPDVKATYSVYAQVTHPLAEAGYYVFPVAVVNETFKQNGLTSANDIHHVDPKKLQQIFGADAALYLTVTQYGSTYKVLSSVVTVAAEAKLVDLRTGALLWANQVVVVDNGDQSNSGGGLVGALVKAAVTQILNTTMDRAYTVARTANERLLAGGTVNGLLYGPRSPNYKGHGRARPAAMPATTAAPDLVTVSTAPVDAPPPMSAAPALVMAEPTAVAAAAPVAEAPAVRLSGPEQRYADVLRSAQAQYAALDPTSNWYRSDLYDWVMERKAEFIAAGKTPDVALQRAIALMETR